MDTLLLDGTEAIKIGSRLIKNGEVVVFPTETVYGIGADAFNVNAINKIYIAKGRPSDNPLIVHVSNKNQIARLVKSIPDNAQKLIDNFMPGPITIIMQKNPLIPKEVTGGLDSVGIRMPSHPIAQAFIEACGCPIAAPSANISTHISPTNSRDVYEDMAGRVPLIIEGGNCSVGIESTIVDLTCDVPTILRPGGITQDMIAKVLGVCANFKGEVKIAKAPGMKYKHYAPSCPMVVANTIDSMIYEYNKKLEEGLNPILLISENNKSKILNMRYVCVGNKDDEIMRNIFACMHEAQKISNYIICQDFGEEGKYFSIMNRINKAAGGVRV